MLSKIELASIPKPLAANKIGYPNPTKNILRFYQNEY